MRTKYYLLIGLLSLVASTSLHSRTKFDLEYEELNGANRARVRSTNIAENVVQLAHPQLQTYVRVESQQRSDGHYELDISIKDLKSGKIMARPQLIAKPGELAQIEVGQEGGGYKLSVRATPN